MKPAEAFLPAAVQTGIFASSELSPKPTQTCALPQPHTSTHPHTHTLALHTFPPHLMAGTCRHNNPPHLTAIQLSASLRPPPYTRFLMKTREQASLVFLCRSLERSLHGEQRRQQQQRW